MKNRYKPKTLYEFTYLGGIWRLDKSNEELRDYSEEAISVGAVFRDHPDFSGKMSETRIHTLMMKAFCVNDFGKVLGFEFRHALTDWKGAIAYICPMLVSIDELSTESFDRHFEKYLCGQPGVIEGWIS